MKHMKFNKWIKDINRLFIPRPTKEINKSKSLKCTVKGCRKSFATESNMKIHITRKHKEI